MTCLERLKQLHPDWTEGQILDYTDDCCPESEGIMDDPDYCAPMDACARCWGREIPGTKVKQETTGTKVKQETTGTTETVDHPKHYGREGAMECIDEMVLVFGVEATQHFCLLNAWKYRYRAADKGGEEDMRKSDWYMAKYAELKGVI